MQQYIRIDEAVKKYGKSRQTFYNYINKNFLEVKKVNNRLFLDTQAIENLMHTIVDGDEIEKKYDNETITSRDDSVYMVMQEQFDELGKSFDSVLVQQTTLHTSLAQKISSIKEELLYDFKNIIGVQLNHVITNQNTQLIKTEHIENKIYMLTQSLLHHQVFYKKVYIYGFLLVCMFINIIVFLI